MPKLPCPGLSVETGMFSGCLGGTDCPTCEGTSEMINCPACGQPLDKDDTCGPCEMIWAEV